MSNDPTEMDVKVAKLEEAIPQAATQYFRLIILSADAVLSREHSGQPCGE